MNNLPENFIDDLLYDIEFFGKERACMAYNGWWRHQDPDEILSEIATKLKLLENTILQLEQKLTK